MEVFFGLGNGVCHSDFLLIGPFETPLGMLPDPLDPSWDRCGLPLDEGVDFGSSVPQTPAAADRHSGVGDDDLVVGSNVRVHLSRGDQGAVNFINVGVLAARKGAEGEPKGLLLALV